MPSDSSVAALPQNDVIAGRHPEAQEQRVKGVSRTRLPRVRKAEGSP